jgi:hypothetical protein
MLKIPEIAGNGGKTVDAELPTAERSLNAKSAAPARENKRKEGN